MKKSEQIKRNYLKPDFREVNAWTKEDCCTVIATSKVHGGGASGGDNTDELEAAGQRGCWDDVELSKSSPFDN